MEESIQDLSITWALSICKLISAIAFSHSRYVERNGTFKLDVVNLNYHFESVVVEILSVDENDEQAKKRQIRAYMYNIKSGKDYKLVYPL